MEKCLKNNKMQKIVYILTKGNEFRQVYINTKLLIEDELFAVISFFRVPLKTCFGFYTMRFLEVPFI